MVEDRITDGKRIAQLLASEMTGLETGPLEAVEVVDANADAVPSESGTVAYRLTFRDDTVATVTIYPRYAEVGLHIDPPWSEESSTPEVASDDDSRLRLTSGAQVKRGVDAIRVALESDVNDRQSS